MIAVDRLHRLEVAYLVMDREHAYHQYQNIVGVMASCTACTHFEELLKLIASFL